MMARNLVFMSVFQLVETIVAAL